MPEFLKQEQIEHLRDSILELVESKESSTAVVLGIRQVFEKLYRYLCEDSKRSFTGLFARIQFIHDSYSLDRNLTLQANQLRILCNRVVHEGDVQISKTSLGNAFAAIVLLLDYFCSGFSDAKIKDFLHATNAKPFIKPKDSSKSDVIGIVNSYRVNEDKSGIEIELTNEDGIQCNLLLRDDLENPCARAYTKLAKALWKYATLACYHMSEVVNRPHFYISNHHSLIVLEPDFLVDVSSVAECFQDKEYYPELYILNRLQSEKAAENMIQGKLVNGILDDMISDESQDFAALFRKGVRSLPIPLATFNYEQVLNIRNRIEKLHMDNLKSFVDSLKGHAISVEPSYIAPQYGLQGRIDVLTYHDGKYSVTELKSGAAPQLDTWKANQMQVIGYNMMIHACYGKSNCSSSSILYSSAKANPLRNVVTLPLLEQELMLCRNRLVGILHNLAEDPKLFFDWFRSANLGYKADFLKAKATHAQKVLQNCNDYEYEWFCYQLKRIVGELWSVKLGSTNPAHNNTYGFNALWKQHQTVKVQNYDIIADATLFQVDDKNLYLKISAEAGVSNFRNGDIVILYRSHLAVAKQELTRGRIESFGKDELQISVRGGIHNNHRFSLGEKWCIEHDVMESSLYASLSSVFTFLESIPKISKAVILGKQPPQVADTNIPLQGEDANEIGDKLWHAKDYFIIQGPPGTGKTSGLLSNYVKRVFEQSTKKVIILSFTNRAIDEICINLDRIGVSYLRTGNSFTIKENLLYNRIADKNFKEVQALIRENRIWVSTVQSCNHWYQDLLSMVSIDELIIDEASQIVETGVLGIISKIPKLILIGDQNQLPPISIQDAVTPEETPLSLQELGYGISGDSLLERLHYQTLKNSWDHAFSMLTKHYRMHDEIASLILPYYQNRLVSQTPRQIATLDIKTSSPQLPKLFLHRCAWIDAPLAQRKRHDQEQADLAVQIASLFIQLKLVSDPLTQLGIIAPYRAMIVSILKILPPEMDGITVDTVERFQGSERDNIIICLPLREKTELSSIQSLNMTQDIDRKLNVAVSRAKERLIFIGNADLCSHSPHYMELITNIKKGGYFTAIKELKWQIQTNNPS